MTETQKSGDAFFSKLSAPAQRALKNAGIMTPRQLSQYSEKDVLTLHGMGRGSIPKMRELLNSHGLSFKAQ